jgi:hypothetical protein
MEVSIGGGLIKLKRVMVRLLAIARVIMTTFL